MTSQDWAKWIIEFKDQVNGLRKELIMKDEELGDLKKWLLNHLHWENQGAHQPESLFNIFERQTHDLMYAKKIISEYEKREGECTKKWNDLLNENILNSEKI